ncbi:MAG: hypothetical protein DI635_14795 [Pseudoxanthomonas suwonensis]|nr:MAG: hypothetical protein DI635_14795 [Pseudoxanthomonas suwonensis]
MDRNEKKRIRDRIGEHLDVSRTRMSDDEASTLEEFIDGYDDNYKGRSETRTRSFDGWSSDGKYTRHETYTDTFTDEVGIRRDYEYKDDDGQTGSSSQIVKDARGVLDWLKDQR